MLVSVFGDQLVGNLVVRRRYLVLHLLAHQHGEVTETLAAFLALRRRPSPFAVKENKQYSGFDIARGRRMHVG